MKIIKKILEPISYKGKEKLSKLSIFFLLILSLLTFSVLSMGIHFQSKVINNPDVLYPYQCRNYFKKSTDIGIEDIKNNMGNYYYSSYRASKQELVKNKIYPTCKDLNKKINYVKKVTDINILKEKIKKLERKIRKNDLKIRNIRRQYNTILFERISGETSDINNQKKIEYNQLQEDTKLYKDEIMNLTNTFKNHKDVKSLNNFIHDKDRRNEVLTSYKKDKKYYYIKKDLIALLFTLPLFFIALYSTKKYLKENKYTPYILSKTLLLIFSIPIVINTLSIVYELLPKVFLTKLFKWLISLNIPFIMYYILIFVAIAIFSFVIFKIQKKQKENELNKPIIEKRSLISYSQCTQCKNKVDYVNMNNCPYCGNELKKECKSCKKNTLIKDLEFCYNCGKTENS